LPILREPPPLSESSGPLNTIGLACSLHDPAIAIVNARGDVTFAESAERYLQDKRAFGSTPDAFFRIPDLVEQYCDPGADLVVARTWSSAFQREQPGRLRSAVKRLQKARARAARWPWLRTRFFGDVDAALLDAALGELTAQARYIEQCVRRYATTGAAIEYHCTSTFGRLRRRVRFVDCEHHASHAWYACLASPFESAVCAVVDGEGEGRASTFYRYERGRVTELPVARSKYETSLGALYSFVTDLCGFDSWRGEEWKLMGLASYGTPRADHERMLRELIEVDGLLTVMPQRSQARSLAGFAKLLAIKRRPEQPALEYADLARSMQKVFGDVMVEVLRHLRAQVGGDHLVYTGGCALNSAFNGDIVRAAGFRDVYVPSAPADNGNAIGAALMALVQNGGTITAVRPGASSYLGSSMSGKGLSRLLQFSGLGVVTLDEATLCQTVASLLAAGHIVGWVQGRAEFGPRALGNRSILADPRSPDVKERINALVKFREEFRPFAPSILAEHGPDYFEDFQPSPYMERTLRFRDEAVNRVPGVVHVDRTGRLQTVTAQENPRFHRLISCFHALTGVPVLLNTSFNVMGKPIAHGVEDAISVFYTSGIDVLVIEDHVIAKAHVGLPAKAAAGAARA
jgi:carbamoyltransferase